MIELNIWKAIGDFFTNVLFTPFDFFREINDSENWWAANTINIILFFIGVAFFAYWFTQMAKFKRANTEDSI